MRGEYDSGTQTEPELMVAIEPGFIRPGYHPWREGEAKPGTSAGVGETEIYL